VWGGGDALDESAGTSSNILPTEGSFRTFDERLKEWHIPRSQCRKLRRGNCHDASSLQHVAGKFKLKCPKGMLLC
jgi:hypothetical protein